MKLANVLDFLYKTHTSHNSAQQYRDFFNKFPSNNWKEYIFFSFLNYVTGRGPCCSVVVELDSPAEGDTCNNREMKNGAFREVLEPSQGVKDDHDC